jgi:hypothetical protein
MVATQTCCTQEHIGFQALIWLQTVGDVSICTLMDDSQEIMDAGSHWMHAWHTVMYDGDTVC